MENASKALLIGVGVLIAVMIIGLTTRLFNSASEVTQTYYSRELSDELNAFNSNFTKYIGAVVNEEAGTEQKYATIYDVISVANFAWNYNVEAVENPQDPNIEPERILHINLADSTKRYTKNNLQNCSQQTFYTLMQNCYYKPTGIQTPNNIMNFAIEINKTNGDGRINTVTFYPQSAEIDNIIISTEYIEK